MLAIVGGTGLQNLEGLAVIGKHSVETPFGATSTKIIEGRYGDESVFFLARHGAGHHLIPSEINYRANIYALKSLGVTRILGISAVGSLEEDIYPGDFVVPTQYLDFTKGVRKSSFFGDGLVAHVSMAEPICPALSSVVQKLATSESKARNVHSNKTYACVEGPRLGTKAESLFLRSSGCQIVGMTNVPEAFLAREAQICYVSLCVVTDFDSWMEDTEKRVSVEKIFSLFKSSLSDVEEIVQKAITVISSAECTQCRTLSQWLVTTPDQADPDKRQLLELLLR